jgi:hypothetical protein
LRTSSLVRAGRGPCPRGRCADLQDVALVGELERGAGVLLDQQDRRALLLQRLHRRHDALHHDRRQTHRGLVEHEQLGRLIIARPMASICCSPPEKVPAGCFERSPRIGKRSYAACRSSLISPSVCARTHRAAGSPRRTAAGRSADPRGSGPTERDDLVGRGLSIRLPSKVIFSGGGADEAGDGAQRGRLAGAVRADEADDLALTRR